MAPLFKLYQLLDMSPSSAEVETEAHTMATQIIGPILIGVIINIWLYGMMLMRKSVSSLSLLSQ